MSLGNTLQRSELKNAFVSFIPDGTVISGSPVEIDSWPSDSSAYVDWRFKNTQSLKPEPKTADRTELVPSLSGGYEEHTKKRLLGMSFIGTTIYSNSLFKQLEAGLSSVPVVGVPQEPLARRAAFIDGVVLIEEMDETLQTVVERWQFWCRLSLDTGSGAENAEAVLTYRLQLIKTGADGLNTQQFN